MIELSFDELLQAVERLPAEDQSALVYTIQRRLADQERQRILRDVEEGRAEFAAGKVQRASVEEIMRQL
jgi:hypothetical protein